MDDLRIALQHTIRPDATQRMPEASSLNQPNGTSAMGDYIYPGPQSHAKEYKVTPGYAWPHTPQSFSAEVDNARQAKLASLLKEAADAHHTYEATLSAPDTDWPAWYAAYILGRF